MNKAIEACELTLAECESHVSLLTVASKTAEDVLGIIQREALKAQ